MIMSVVSRHLPMQNMKESQDGPPSRVESKAMKMKRPVSCSTIVRNAYVSLRLASGAVHTSSKHFRPSCDVVSKVVANVIS
jgi:hypothetical protein